MSNKIKPKNFPLRTTLELSFNSERCSGRTQRQVDYAIQLLFDNNKVVVLDHWENGQNKLANRTLLERIETRLIRECRVKLDSDTEQNKNYRALIKDQTQRNTVLYLKKNKQ